MSRLAICALSAVLFTVACKQKSETKSAAPAAAKKPVATTMDSTQQNSSTVGAPVTKTPVVEAKVDTSVSQKMEEMGKQVEEIATKPKVDVAQTLERLNSFVDKIKPFLALLGIKTDLIDQLQKLAGVKKEESTNPLDKIKDLLSGQKAENPVGQGVLETLGGILSGKPKEETGEEEMKKTMDGMSSTGGGSILDKLGALIPKN